jgi:hypothetical protein
VGAASREFRVVIEHEIQHRERQILWSALTSIHIAPPGVIQSALADSQVVGLDGDDTPVTLRDHVAAVMLAHRARGIALRERIYVRTSELDEHDRIPIDLLVHEMAHVVQFYRDGTLSFLWRYAMEYLWGRLEGLDDRDAYLAISYEREARRAAEALDGDDHDEAGYDNRW